MTPEQEQALLDEVARAIQQQAQTAFDAMIERLRAGEAPREAIAAVTATFAGAYYEKLSTAFSTLLDRAIGAEEIKAWPVADVELSRHLYANFNQANQTVVRLIAEQRQGFVQARTLAMQIYEGYRFKEDPLKVKAKLPKYLREALRDPAIDGGFARIIASIRANQLKTPALKAGYLQLLDALEQEAGIGRIKKLAKVAWYERNRYFANRIAQTELHRAYSNQVAQEIMADDAAVWVKIQMSPTHPVRDICDFHAGLNAWGKGPGIYPKAKAPKPGFHPHCRCTVRPAYEIDDEPGAPIPDAEARFMNRLTNNDQRLIAGSRARLEAFRQGESLESIYNAGKRPLYQWQRLGDGLPPQPSRQSQQNERTAQAISGQSTWKERGRPDLRSIDRNALELAPPLLAAANTERDAIDVLSKAIGVESGSELVIQSPVERIIMRHESLKHVVEKRSDQRERFGRFVLPTLARPTEIWRVQYDDGSVRNRYVKLFSGYKYDIMAVVKVQPDGSIFWNLMHRDRKRMNSFRIGDLIFDGL